MFTVKDLDSHEYDPYFKNYLGLVDKNWTLQEALELSLQETIAFIDALERPLSLRYASDKWSIAQVFMHNLDTERIFQYRALRFLRGDTTPLAGFNQDQFVDAQGDLAFAKADLKQSFATTRAATMDIFKNTTQGQLQFKGNASGKYMTARVIPFLIAGHNKHHERVIAERY